MSRRAGLLILLALAASAYGLLDVRQRARIDRGVKRHRTDFTVYQYAARALAAGDDPYEATNPRGYRYVYPPLLAVLLLPLAAWAPPDAAFVWFVLSMLAFAGALWAASRWPVRDDGGAVGWQPVLIAAFAICVGFAHQGFQRGQITHILLALQVLALTALFARRHALAGVLLAVAAALRLTPLLPAAAVGIGLVAGLRATGMGPLLRYTGGLTVGLVLGFVVVPLVVLGPERARNVTLRWVEVTRAVYGAAPGELQDLEATYKINEYRFKNQAPRRVMSTWAGWLTGASFERERPDLSAAGWTRTDLAAGGLAWLVIGLCTAVGAVGMRGPPDARYALWFALVVLAPVVVTRYAWPTHFLMALPALALAIAAGRRSAVLVFFGGTALFYAAHAEALSWVGAAGCLLLATGVFIVLAAVPLIRRHV